MGLLIGDDGLLMLHDGLLFTDENGTDCCCGEVVNCCAILEFYGVLHITGDIEGIVSGAGQGCFSGDITVPLAGYSIADFVFCCEDGVSGQSGIFRITFTISISDPACDAVPIEVTFTQQLPCCPLDQTFVVPIPTACDPSGVLTFTVRTPDEPPCPEPDAS